MKSLIIAFIILFGIAATAVYYPIQVDATLTGDGTAETPLGLASAIGADKLGDGSVSTTEYQYIGTLTSDAQTQINAKSPTASPSFTGTVTMPTPFTLGATSVTSTGTQLNYLNAATGTTGTTSTNLVFSTSPTLVTPALGTPASGVLTNCTGTASGLTAGNVTTNANLTGDVTSSGNATTIAAASETTVNNNTGGWVTYKVSGSNATTTGTSLTDVTGLVTGTLSTSSNYEFEAVLWCTTSAVTTGTKYGVNVTGTGSPAAYAVYMGAVTSTTGATTSTNALNTGDATAFLTTSAANGMIIIKGIFVTGTGSPAFSIKHLKVTSGTSTVKVGSTLRIRKI